MTPSDFSAALRLTGLSADSRSVRAAYLALCEEQYTVYRAAHQVGITQPAVWNAYRRIVAAHELIASGGDCPQCGRGF